MEGRLIVLFAALTVFLASGVQGTAHLSFATNNTVNITRDGCGTTKLCLSTPDNCDPAMNGTCLFASIVADVMAPNGANLSVELRGESMGYIAMALTQNASEGTSMLFACAQNTSDNGTFFFRTGQLNNTNGMVTPAETRVVEIQGTVKDNMIRCEFDILRVNAIQPRNAATTFNVLLGSGNLTSSGFPIGAFSRALASGLLNVADPASNIANTTMAPGNMTTAPATTASSGAVHYPHALLILPSVFTLFAMLRA